jgi:hypothetical protein
MDHHEHRVETRSKAHGGYLIAARTAPTDLRCGCCSCRIAAGERIWRAIRDNDEFVVCDACAP